jgi:putative Holliday junction resolvase
MKLLGIDYGRAKVGIAMGDTESRLAEPVSILRYKDTGMLSEKISDILKKEQIEKIVIGLSEGEIGEESKALGEKLEKELKTRVEYVDETLTSFDAQSLSISAGINRKKRKGMEDAYSAALILQSYLDRI